MKTGPESFSKKNLWWTMIALLLALGGIYLYSFGLRFVYRHWGLFFCKTGPTQWPDGAQEKIKTAVSGLRGKIVWSSSRSGDHQIYLLTLPDLRTYQLTTNPHVDYYPRLSPEGGRIVLPGRRNAGSPNGTSDPGTSICWS